MKFCISVVMLFTYKSILVILVILLLSALQFIFYTFQQPPTPKLSAKIVSHVDFGAINFDDCLQQARKIVHDYNIVYITLINDAFLDLTQNWLCNTNFMLGVHNRTLIGTIEEKTASFLRLNWPHVSVCRLKGGNLDTFDKFLVWGQEKYISFMSLR